MARRSGRSRGLVDALLSFLITPKYRDEFTDPAGGRRMLLPFELIAGDPVELGADHYLLHASSDWPAPVIAHTIERKRAGLQVAFISYDTIPLMFPHFYTAKSSARFRSMFHATMPVADLVMVTAHQVASDIRDYCARNDLPVPGIRVFRPGADLIIDDQAGQTELPPGVEPGKYAIFVSTVEPRKGHALLFRVWKRLVAAGVQQATGFKLVLVGRRGWLTDDLVAEIEGDPTFGSSLLLYSGVADNLLSSLYSNAAFGLYPSLYEGYGLPVVELFKYGKAVIASSGGALREVVADFSPSLDPRDEDVWFETMRDWMEDPSARAPFEAAVRQRFSHPTWDEASATFFEILQEELGPRTNADRVE
jgi:glycosyltransferase involved in cell wall biosynthesis